MRIREASNNNNNNEQQAPELRQYKLPRTFMRSALKKSRPIRGCSLTFNLVKAPENQDTYILELDQINEVPQLKNTQGREQLPATNLLEEWDLEVRRRESKHIDRLFSHPRSVRILRTMKQVADFIGDNYDPSKRIQIRPGTNRIPFNKMHILPNPSEDVQSAAMEETPDEIPVPVTLTNDVGTTFDLNEKLEEPANEIPVPITLANGVRPTFDLNVKLEPEEND